MHTEQRPAISAITRGEDLKRWYWLKDELVAYCREHGIPYSAGKFELLERISHHLDTGRIPQVERTTTRSAFNWATAPLTRETIITDSYRNTQNMRHFMLKEIGAHFRFNSDFMDWMRASVGRKLEDAIQQWQLLAARKTEPDFQTDIADHNQYNQYLRDFFAAQPLLTMQEARRCWQYKRSQPSVDGRHVYASTDLEALQSPPAQS